LVNFKIAFRTDASLVIGTGHFMRCLTLADELRNINVEVLFICHNLPNSLQEMLVDHGIALVPIASDLTISNNGDLTHSKWLWTDQIHDAKVSLQAIGDDILDWIIVDHYALDQRWEVLMRKASKRIMVIDDLADRQHDCDILLDQNYFPDFDKRYDALLTKEPIKLLGPSYILLRPEFLEIKGFGLTKNDPPRRLLVSFGGVDVDNLTAKVVALLQILDWPDLEVDVVVGDSFPWKNEVKSLCNCRSGFSFYSQINNMASLMLDADLAISAGGFTMYELAYSGVPSLIIPLSPIQEMAAQSVANFGAAINIGAHSYFPEMQLRSTLLDLKNSKSRRRRMSTCGQSLVDGLGVSRITKLFRLQKKCLMGNSGVTYESE